jgi:hypothetical protein
MDRRGRLSYTEIAASNGAFIMNFQDIALRTLIIVAGAVSAVLLVLKGQAAAVPALAIGATLGAFAMRFGATEE